jgi:hypothetical protein
VIRKSLFLAAAMSLPAAAIAQQATFDQARLREHIRILSDDNFEGRGPATAGETKTVQYLTQQFQAAGLQPGGELIDGKRTWTQRVPLLKSDHVSAPQVTVTTAAGSLPLAQGEQIAVRSPTNGQQQFSLDNVPILFAGYGVTAPERQWDDFKDVDVRGKIIVVLVNDPDFVGGEGSFGGKAMTYYGRWTYK